MLVRIWRGEVPLRLNLVVRWRQVSQYQLPFEVSIKCHLTTDKPCIYLCSSVQRLLFVSQNFWTSVFYGQRSAVTVGQSTPAIFSAV